ncbi:four helix bundle protein [Chryseobacterium rhizosphaerae]|uniref:four helix bundle protein n=1 Tax=Chryseobacterium rhizosphaerae TaxID=395937 RepID=UPI0023594C0E|nr:four helix bundle protein [Chryseobacterium rhizosphaerae]MDC8101915.1 four helix bundle protein [Chryseobacterium rhizosphaerae]
MSKDYTELEVWIEGRKLVNLTYILTTNFPKEEVSALTSQIRRAAISVRSNIAEGCGRRISKDTLHFLLIARGSLYELETQFYLALDQVYISKDDFEIVNRKILLCKKLISGFINYYKKIENEK